jgi:hypothetical protein
MVFWIWVLFAVANLIDLAVQGRDHLSLIAAAILVVVTGVAYDTAQRPRIVAADDGITVKNPLRDHHIPWPRVDRVDLSDLLRVHCRPPGPTAAEQVGLGAPGDKSSKVISAWAVHYSRRRQYSADIKARRASTRQARGSRRPASYTQFGIPQSVSSSQRVTGPPENPESTAEAEANKIVRALNDMAATAAIARATDAATDAAQAAQKDRQSQPAVYDTGDVTSNWSWPAIAALVIPALILLICCLV